LTLLGAGQYCPQAGFGAVGSEERDRLDWIGAGIGFGITFTVVALGLAWRTRRRGNLLLDTGALDEPVLSRNLATYIPLVILLALVWLRSRSAGPEPLIMMALALVGVLAVVFVLKKRTRLRFTDQGICFVGFIKWGEIQSYRWDKDPEGSEELVLGISRKGRSFTIGYPVPAIHRERVAEILAAHVPRAS
jgi:hypothetical protein